MNGYFINTAGEIALKINNFQVAGNFHEGLAPVMYAQYFFGFIDKTGQLVIETPFVEVRNFSGGLAVVKTQEKGVYGKSKTKWGAIDKTGCLIFEADFERLYDFAEEIAVAENADEWFFINPGGEITKTFSKDEVFFNYNVTKRFSEGLIAVHDFKTGKFGFMNRSGEFVIAPKFENAANFSEGLARVSVIENQKESLGFINPEGEFVIEPRFDIDADFLRNSNDFSEGLSALIDGPLKLDKDPSFMFIDKNGEIVLHPEFFRAEPFHNGLAVVTAPVSGIYGYIDKTGELAIPIKYNFASNFSEGLALVA
jgi:hypothetical protein